MPSYKVVVLYPRPTDVEEFERAYVNEHMQLAQEKIINKTKMVFSKVLAAPDGEPKFYRVAELYFPSIEAIQQSFASPSSQEAAADVIRLSTGGPPVFLICEEGDAV